MTSRTMRRLLAAATLDNGNGASGNLHAVLLAFSPGRDAFPGDIGRASFPTNRADFAWWRLSQTWGGKLLGVGFPTPDRGCAFCGSLNVLPPPRRRKHTPASTGKTRWLRSHLPDKIGFGRGRYL